MRRLKAIDWVLISTLLPICLVGVVMSVVDGVRGDFVRHSDLAIRGRSQPETVHALPLHQSGP